jgi:hypothetical protein
MTTVVILSIGVAIAVALPIAWRVRQRRFDPFEPIVVFALAWGVMFVVRPIAIVIRDDTNFYGVDIGSTLDEAVLLGLVGAVAFALGYWLSLGTRLAARLPAVAQGTPSPAALVWSVVVACVGLALLALVIVPGEGLDGLETFLGGRSEALNEIIDNSSSYLWYGSLVVVPAALVSSALALETRSSSAIALALTLGVIAMLRVVPTGNRAFLVVLVGGVVVFAFLRAARRPGIVAMCVGIVVALVASRAVLEVRDPETRRDVPTVLRAIVTTPRTAFSPLYRGPDAEMAPALAGALTAIPDPLGYRLGGATFGDVVLRPVPRELWDEKPRPHITVVTEEVWPVAVETGGFNPAFTPLLAFYWDFWLLGVFAGMALLGVLARAGWEYFLRFASSFSGQLLFATALCYLVVVLRHDHVLTSVWALIQFVPLIAILRLSTACTASALPSQPRGGLRGGRSADVPDA